MLNVVSLITCVNPLRAGTVKVMTYDPFKVNVEILAPQFVQLAMAFPCLAWSRVCHTLQLLCDL